MEYSWMAEEVWPTMWRTSETLLGELFSTPSEHSSIDGIFNSTTPVMSDQVGSALERINIARSYFLLLEPNSLGKRSDSAVISGMRFTGHVLLFFVFLW